jgi:hypothetical protein
LGAVCQRAPTAFSDWSIDFDISARGTDSGGLGITFLYSDTVCPIQPDTFRGFQLTVNTSSPHSDETPVYFSEGSFATSTERGTIKFRNQRFPTKLQITRTNKKLWVRYTTFTRFIPLFSVDLTTDIPAYGYFTIFASTEPDHSDNNDLYSVRTQAESDVHWDAISAKQLTDNRKVIESDATNRRAAKQARRSALLPTMRRCLESMAAADNRLAAAPGRPQMQDAFSLVEEAAKRGMEAVTIDMLKVFINRYLQDTLAGAGKKVNLAMERFDDSRAEISEMWTYLRMQLTELAVESRLALDAIVSEAREAAKQVRIDGVSQETVVREAAGEADGVSKVLIVVGVAELVAYIVFFARQHTRTHGFKKAD